MLKFLNNHKTKIVGFLITLLGAVQASAGQLGAVLSPKAYAWTMIAIGIVVAVLGFINTALASGRAEQ